MTMPAAMELHTVEEVAERFHVHSQTVRVWIRKKHIGHVRVGRYLYVTGDQLAAFIDARRYDADD